MYERRGKAGSDYPLLPCQAQVVLSRHQGEFPEARQQRDALGGPKTRFRWMRPSGGEMSRHGLGGQASNRESEK